MSATTSETRYNSAEAELLYVVSIVPPSSRSNVVNQQRGPRMSLGDRQGGLLILTGVLGLAATSLLLNPAQALRQSTAEQRRVRQHPNGAETERLSGRSTY